MKEDEFETNHANADGWCNWTAPTMRGYRMKCCDCGLVHDVEFDVVRVIEVHEDGSWTAEPVGRKAHRVLMRMRRERDVIDRDTSALPRRDEKPTRG